LSTFTPIDAPAFAEHDEKKKRLLNKLMPMLVINERFIDFCTHPDAVVTLTVKPEDEPKLFKKQYPMAESLKPAVKEILMRWLSTGKIKKLTQLCRFNSPLLAVPKKDEHGKMTGVRLCIDIRTLNQHLQEDDKFQLPHIPEVLAQFAGGSLFGEVDLSEAYFQFKVKEESQKYTAFTWDSCQYVFVGCPFGIKHIPSLYQRFITNLFSDMPFVFPYIDNLGFASKDWEEHYEHARMIIERLNSVGMRIKPSSYNFGNTSIKLLGHVITQHGIALDPEKSEMIAAWPKPVEGIHLASCLGLGAFLRDHIRNYADITAPLEGVKREKTVTWTPLLDAHWTLLKRAFATAPLLKFPDFSKRFVIACDASQTGVGGVLYQPDDDDNTITAHNIVAICSKQLNATQQNYPVYKKELWGLIYCLRKFHSFIWGRRDVTVLTDHKPLIHVLNQRVMTVALQQWVDVLMDYDLKIQYRPGVLHVIPDALSRMYMATYGSTDTTWGTHSSIAILDNFSAVSSPSDFLCQQSLAEIKPMSVVKKRHMIPTKESKGGTDPLASQAVSSATPHGSGIDSASGQHAASLAIDSTFASWSTSTHQNKQRQRLTHKGATVKLATASGTQPDHSYGSVDRANGSSSGHTTPILTIDSGSALSAVSMAADPAVTPSIAPVSTHADNGIEVEVDSHSASQPHTPASIIDTSIAASLQPLPRAHRLSYEEIEDLVPGPDHPLLSYDSHGAYVARIAARVVNPCPSELKEQHEIVDFDAAATHTMTGAQLPLSRRPPLTEEQKMILLAARTGKRIPSIGEQAVLLSKAHAAGHFGEKAMWHHIERQGVWWPHMRADMSKEIASCNDCAKYNTTVHGFRPAQSITALLPGDHYQIDLAQFKKSTNGCMFCLVLVDVFSGFVMLRALKDKSARTVANELFSIFSIIGVPRILQSDNGTEFRNEVLRALTTLLGVPHRFITEYNPRADGKVERLVRTVKQTIMKLLHGATTYWPYHLSFVQYSYNDKVQTLTGSTPFSLMFGRDPNSARDYTVDEKTNLPINLTEWKAHQLKVLSLIFPAVNKRAAELQSKYRAQLDKTHRKLVTDVLPAGTIVRIKDPKFVAVPGMKPSHEHTYIGPYTVQSQTKYGSYRLKDDQGVMLDRSVHIDQIKVVLSPTSLPPLLTDKDAVVDDNERMYVVDKIVKHREKEGELEYYVKWKGYDSSHNTWENEHQFNDTACIDRYFKEQLLNDEPRRQARIRALSTASFTLSISRHDSHFSF
jgi:transposase InsO family protein